VIIQRACTVGIGVLAYIMMSQFETILEMALISYTMIGASLAPVLIAAFFWRGVTRAGGVASIAAGMSTVIFVTVMNKVYAGAEASDGLFAAWFPMSTDYIAIPSVLVAVSTLILVSLVTKPVPKEEWELFIES